MVLVLHQDQLDLFLQLADLFIFFLAKGVQLTFESQVVDLEVVELLYQSIALINKLTDFFGFSSSFVFFLEIDDFGVEFLDCSIGFGQLLNQSVVGSFLFVQFALVLAVLFQHQ
jgi:hypothetical protein